MSAKGGISDKRAKELREAVSVLPLDRVLVETDAPCLTPGNVPGLCGTNLPQNIKYVVMELAKYMKMPANILIEHVRKNTERIFLAANKAEQPGI